MDFFLFLPKLYSGWGRYRRLGGVGCSIKVWEREKVFLRIYVSVGQIIEEIQEVEVFTLSGACVFKATPSISNVFSETLNLSSAI